jgi:hypothetical protein
MNLNFGYVSLYRSRFVAKIGMILYVDFQL